MSGAWVTREPPYQAQMARINTQRGSRGLARLYEEVGERTKQRDVFQRILQISPEDDDARRALRRFQAMTSSSGSAPVMRASLGSGSTPPPPPVWNVRTR